MKFLQYLFTPINNSNPFVIPLYSALMPTSMNVPSLRTILYKGLYTAFLEILKVFFHKHILMPVLNHKQVNMAKRSPSLVPICVYNNWNEKMFQCFYKYWHLLSIHKLISFRYIISFRTTTLSKNWYNLSM